MMASVVRGGLGVFRIAPPITISKPEIDLALEIFDSAITKSLGQRVRPERVIRS
jgi:2,2-dialkylglycine decarboxylase (pyruvate)